MIQDNVLNAFLKHGHTIMLTTEFARFKTVAINITVTTFKIQLV